MDIEGHQDIIVNSHRIFTVLSSIDNLKVFSAAKDGLKMTKPLLERLGISKAKYRKAIDQLKDAGLIEKAKNEQEEDEFSYIHTTYGSIIYQTNILDMGKYTKYADKMHMTDAIKRAQKFSGVIAMFNEQIINNIVDSGGASHSVVSASTSSAIASDPSSFSIPDHKNIDDKSSTSIVNANAIPKARIVLSYDNIVQLLRERIEVCKNEILIATRTSPEIIINRILQKSKMGVKVRVVADTELVRQYFESQREFTAANDTNNDDDNNYINTTNTHDSKRKVKDNASKKNNIDDDYDYQHQQERRNIIANPYYPNTNIHRRISDLPFSMIILDGSEVGVELVNSNNSKEFFAGVWIKDEEFAMAMKSFYQTLWNKASENIPT
jgi:predicted transcriptional regulator